ncbi:MAG: hypothetical protein K0R65_414 [Crocinitomicaceae bacterium]|jgi:hypothetical protein|nr:hypothetical protein [Crocinitomicaceae bacterium]
MRKKAVHSAIILFILVFFYAQGFAQQKPIPLHTYYKTNFLKYSGKNAIESFYPANESQLNLNDSLRDTTIFYYDFVVWFFQRNWIELKQPEGKININPFINLSYGRSLGGNDSLPLYRNMRGININGEFFNKVGFNFSLCENQSRFQSYESLYFEDRGELYDQGNVYQKTNAVIPSGGRTKPFKADGYDYAYSFGMITYEVNKKLRIEAGNNPHFIGSGYRSLLLSDNSFYAPYVRLYWKISPMLSYQVLYRKHRNLFRKPATLAVEKSYENKLFSASYLTFKPLKNLAFSLFTAGNQLRADSVSYYPVEGQMFVPLPLFNTDMAFESSRINGIAGLNIDFALEKFKFYGQFVLDKYRQTYLTAFQAGGYYFDAFKVKNLNLQLEVNVVPDNFYASDNVKLNYSQYNMPLAHIKGNNFTEIYANVNYELRRLYGSYSFLVYQSRGGTINEQIYSNSIFQTDKAPQTFSSGSTLIQTYEIGYRINRLYNPTLFAQTQIRSSVFGDTRNTFSYLMLGLKVNLNNQYLDF